MSLFAGKEFGYIPAFDPAAGMLVREAPGSGPGWWSGAPSSYFDSHTNTFYLVYRVRHPRELGRGIECRVAASENGVTFHDIWALPRNSLDALSVERSSVFRGRDGRWHLLLSYCSATDNRWHIGKISADEPDQFDVSTMTPWLSPDDVAAEGVKDPVVYQLGAMLYILVSYAVLASTDVSTVAPHLHSSGDVYNTGFIRSRTGALMGIEGQRGNWLGDVSPICQPILAGVSISDGDDDGSAWDAYCRRISTIVPLEIGGFLAYYDGSATVNGNYEEQTGLAYSTDLRTFHSLTPDAPLLTSQHSTGSLRYVDVLSVGHELFYYYETACPDGSHELRVAVVDR